MSRGSVLGWCAWAGGNPERRAAAEPIVAADRCAREIVRFLNVILCSALAAAELHRWALVLLRGPSKTVPFLCWFTYIFVPIFLCSRYGMSTMAPKSTDPATHLTLHSPFSPAQAECQLRRAIEPANPAGLFRYTPEANRSLFAGTIEHGQFHLRLVHPRERQRYTLAITGDIAASATGSTITLHITDGGLLLSPLLLRLVQIAVFAIPTLFSIYFVSLWWGTLSFGCGIFPGVIFLFALWLLPALGKSDPDTANAISHLWTVFAAQESTPISTP